jgi:hypothetical protein
MPTGASVFDAAVDWNPFGPVHENPAAPVVAEASSLSASPLQRGESLVMEGTGMTAMETCVTALAVHPAALAATTV